MPTLPPRHNGKPSRPRRNHLGDVYASKARDSHAFLCSQQWLALRMKVLANHPLCVECRKHNIVKAATDVDHIAPRSDRPDLALAEHNLQPLCKRCHSVKTRREFNGRTRKATYTNGDLGSQGQLASQDQG